MARRVWPAVKRRVVRRGGGGRSSAPDRPAPGARRTPRIDRILASGLFDPEYYALQRGSEFGSVRAAALDYLQHGRRAGLAPNVLFEPEYFRPGAFRGKREPLLAYLRGDHAGRDPSPLFDQAAHLAAHPAAGDHPGGALGHFLATASDSDPVPAPAGRAGRAPTLAEVRARAWQTARAFREMDALRMAPRRGSWDALADTAFITTWTAAPVRQVPDDDTTGGERVPTVSVVMPVRNRPVQVLEAIASVRAQTFGDWELVVVDDGSTDDTAAVVERAAADEPRIRLVRLPHGGVGVARNAGLAAARGPWLAFLDSDNTWVPHFLHVMLAYLQGNGLRAGHSVIDASAGRPGEEETGYLALDGRLEHLLVKNHVDVNGLVVESRVAHDVGGFDSTLRRWVDHDFAIRVARQTAIPLVPFIGVRYDHAAHAVDRITNTESDHWQWVVLGKNYVDWGELSRRVPERVAGRVSVCMPTYEDWRLTTAAVRAVLADADREADAGGRAGDVEVVILENGSRRAVAALLHAAFLDEPRVRIHQVPRNLNFAIGSNLAFAESTGETVVFLNNDTEVLPGWLAPLLEALDDDTLAGCQPLLVHPRGTVQSAGTAFIGGNHLPSPLLVDHPIDDARRAAPIRLRAVTAAALAMRAADVVGLRGFDPMFVNGFEDVDLCLRAVEGGSRRFAVVTDSVVLHHESRTPGRSARQQHNRKIWMERWRGRLPDSDLGIVERLGFEVAHVSPGDRVSQPGDLRMPRPVLVRPPAEATEPGMRGCPRLRWALKTDVPVREILGDAPDLRRAHALADALSGLGQDVVVDPLEGNQRPTSHFDDVVVAVRGETPLVEEPGRLNIVWPVSSAANVSVLEARRYDAVLAATDAGPALTPGEEWVPPVEHTALLAAVGSESARAVDLEAVARLLLFEAVQRRGTDVLHVAARM